MNDKSLDRLQSRIEELNKQIKDLEKKLDPVKFPDDETKKALWHELHNLKKTLEANQQVLTFIMPTEHESIH